MTCRSITRSRIEKMGGQSFAGTARGAGCRRSPANCWFLPRSRASSRWRAISTKRPGNRRSGPSARFFSPHFLTAKGSSALLRGSAASARASFIFDEPQSALSPTRQCPAPRTAASGMDRLRHLPSRDGERMQTDADGLSRRGGCCACRNHGLDPVAVEDTDWP